MKKASKMLLAGLMAVLLGAAGCVTPPAAEKDPEPQITPEGQEAPSFLDTVDWDAEYDVIVVGYGGAGAVSAVSAAENGAKVLLLEKAPKGMEGGNTRYTCELVLCPTDREKAITYFKLMRGNYQDLSDEIIEAVVDGLMGTEAWLLNHNMNPDTTLRFPLKEFPDFEGSDSMQCVTPDGVLYSGTLFGILSSNVEALSDNIDVWYSTPAVKLIQDKETKIIHGVIAENGGSKINIRTKNGVIMACGGFENNDAMLENYCQIASGKAIGAHYNTGDGVKMCMDVGADLWHMSNVAGPTANFVNPLTNTAMFYGFTSTSSSSGYSGFGNKSMILVGSDGSRFQNEASMGSHGRWNVSGSKLTLMFPENAWCVMDAKAAEEGVTAYKSWSEGMVEEVEKGWVIKADTLDELAAKMNVNAEGLNAEVKKYNAYCAAGEDVEFSRPAATLAAMTSGPYYAFPVSATLTNTQGGARRNAECEILDVWGEPIPHLYSAGEFGSFYPDCYNGGGNLGECIWTGNKAGANAAAVKNDTTQSGMLKKGALDLRAKETAYELGANQYLGRALGMGIDLFVVVTYAGNTIQEVKVVSNFETPGIGSKAVEQIPGKIVAANSTEVDAVTGATVTSKAIMAAVNDAVAQAN